MSRHCYVVGCSNGDYRLKRWKGIKCPEHQVFQGDEPCDCTPPFRLFTFPGEKKDPENRLAWLQAINRADPDEPYKWLQPSRNQVVCSRHFTEGIPTESHPVPELKLKPKRGKRPTGDSNRCRNSRNGRHTKRLKEADQVECSSVPADVDIDGDEAKFSQLAHSTDVSTVARIIIFLLLAVIRRLKEENETLKAENSRLRNLPCEVPEQPVKVKEEPQLERVSESCNLYSAQDLQPNHSTVLKFHNYIPPVEQKTLKGPKSSSANFHMLKRSTEQP